MEDQRKTVTGNGPGGEPHKVSLMKRWGAQRERKKQNPNCNYQLRTVQRSTKLPYRRNWREHRSIDLEMQEEQSSDNPMNRSIKTVSIHSATVAITIER
jgi:hypothetical protein